MLFRGTTRLIQYTIFKRTMTTVNNTTTASSSSSASVLKPGILTFVTGNANKLIEVQSILSQSIPGLELQSAALDLPELQASDPIEISRNKALIAVKQLNRPVLVEDTSLCFTALNGLPGPYIKWFLEKCGHIGLNNLLAAYTDKSAYAQCIFAYCESVDSEPIIFDGRCPGRIVLPRGPNKFGWDPIFQPDQQQQQSNTNSTTEPQTFAEMNKEWKNEISHRAAALKLLKEYFIAHPELVKQK